MTKKRHHYIPRFYLEGFVDSAHPPYIWVYDKENNGTIIRSTAKGIAVTKHYFSFKNIDGVKDCETIENLIAQMEGDGARILKEICSEKSFDEKSKYDFAVFVALMMVRVPNFRENIETAFATMTKKIMQFVASHKENFTAMVKRYEKATGNDLGLPIEEARQMHLNPDKYFYLKTNPQVSLGMAFSQLEDFSKLFYGMNWIFLKTSGDVKFLTGDNPFYYLDPTHDRKSFYGVGLCSPNIEVTLPLSQDYCALGTWKKSGGHRVASTQIVKTINRRTVMACSRFVFASEQSEVLGNFVAKYRGCSPKLQVR